MVRAGADYPDDKVRIVSENARTLKFDSYGFEDSQHNVFWHARQRRPPSGSGRRRFRPTGRPAPVVVHLDP